MAIFDKFATYIINLYQIFTMMKKKLLLTVVALFTAYLCTWAQSGTCGENLTWSIQDGTLTISGTGEMESYSGEYNVPWYNYRNGINNIVIMNGVTSVGDYAFVGCSLTSVTIGNSVMTIGEHAFTGCSKLASVSIPNSVKSIGENAFDGCI